MTKLTVKEIIEDLENLSLGDIGDSIIIENLIIEYNKRLENEKIRSD